MGTIEFDDLAPEQVEDEGGKVWLDPVAWRTILLNAGSLMAETVGEVVDSAIAAEKRAVSKAYSLGI